MKYLKELGMAYFLYRKDLAFFVFPKIAECIINRRFGDYGYNFYFSR